jgi:hypothetical protein
MTLEAFAATALLLGIVAMVVLNVSMGMFRLRLRREVREERTRAHFAACRNSLMEIARRGDVSVKSATFRMLYGVSTAVVRRREQYDDLAQVVGRAVLLPPAPGGLARAVDAEQSTWTPEVRQVAQQLAEGLVMVMRDYSFPMRFILYTLERQGMPLPEYRARLRAMIERKTAARDRTAGAFWGGSRALHAMSLGLALTAAAVTTSPLASSAPAPRPPHVGPRD